MTTAHPDQHDDLLAQLTAAITEEQQQAQRRAIRTIAKILTCYLAVLVIFALAAPAAVSVWTPIGALLGITCGLYLASRKPRGRG